MKRRFNKVLAASAVLFAAGILATLAVRFKAAAAETIPSQAPLVASGFQADSSSPLVLSGGILGDHAVWTPQITPIDSPTIATIPTGQGFDGADCRAEYRQAEIQVPGDSNPAGTLMVNVYFTRCDTYDSSGSPSGAYHASGIYSIVSGTGRFAAADGGTGSIQFDADSDGRVFSSINGFLIAKKTK